MNSDENEDERRVLDLIEKVLDLPENEQRAFLLVQTESDPAFRARALSVFEKNGSDGTFLQTGAALDHMPTEPIPEVVGAYRIEREIGRGGMGAVYFGRRTTTDFDHVAAIKVVRGGSNTARLTERLRSERRALSGLKHPNIAQMYDGGELPDGAPYFVMEYIEGARFDEYMSNNEATLDQRLTLFLDVCDAVAFAHRNLIVHRDLSPANILVSDEGRVKLIDFGVAQSLDDGSTQPGELTPTMSITKGYAAPERREGGQASTMTDVYSLGVILGELVADTNSPRSTDLAAIVSKASAVSQDVRYSSVDALVDDILIYRRGGAVKAVDSGTSYQA